MKSPNVLRSSIPVEDRACLHHKSKSAARERRLKKRLCRRAARRSFDPNAGRRKAAGNNMI